VGLASGLFRTPETVVTPLAVGGVSRPDDGVNASQSAVESRARCGMNQRQGPATPPNTPIKLTVRAVTRRACARRAPTRPAAYRVRYTDPGKGLKCERPCLKRPNRCPSPSLPAWGASGRSRIQAALKNSGFAQQVSRSDSFRARKLPVSPARSKFSPSHPSAGPSRAEAIRSGCELSAQAVSLTAVGAGASQRRRQSWQASV
jgi:hypothetical protein